MNVYQEFIAKSRYARYLEDKKRREHWPETVARYFDFMTEHLRENVGYELSAELRAELESAVLNLEVMPSMRALMTAGPALKRQNLCGYNCSLLLIDDVKSFDELMYLSLCGVGVGFSVERQNVNKLPEIPDQLFPSSTTITVADSKEGWAKALRLLISCLYAGEIPNWDTSKCRPAGAPLKTFGGRSSGPGVLETLFSQVVRMFKEAVGRRLTSLECHDLCCYIAETSESGGSRRSALISLSNLSDDRMRRAKTGNWFDTNIQRTWANNSAVYTEKPDVLKFMEEWKSLIESRSGERGIFNRQAAEQTAQKSGRRKRHEAFGTNPCQPDFATVLTPEGIRRFGDIRPGDIVWSGSRWTKVVDKWSTGVKPVFRNFTNAGSFVGTEEHRVVEGGSKKPVSQASAIDTSQGPSYSAGAFSVDPQAVLDGWVLGDGFWHGASNKAFLCVGAKDGGIFSSEVSDLVGKKSGCGPTAYNIKTTLTQGELPLLPIRVVPERYFTAGPSKRASFLRGLYSANGSICGGRITLKSCCLELILQVQEMLSSLGICSYYTTNKSKMVRFANGSYECSESYDLNIGNKAGKAAFVALVGFVHSYKMEKANKAAGVKDNGTCKRIFAITKREYLGDFPVSDMTVEAEEHTYWSGGLLVSNCGEIVLRPYELCNLTEVVVRPSDGATKLANKVRIASILGTFQSTLVHFPYVRSLWRKNCEEERLLGVSLTGIMDNPLTSNWQNPAALADLLQTLRDTAVQVNRELAEELGINVSTAVTTVKPSGNISQRCGCSSGIHPAHSRYWWRTVRQDNKDPLTQFMKDKGVYWEPCQSRPESTTIFYFPQKASDKSKLRDEVTALEQLTLTKLYKDHWAEHNVSTTISVREHEWLEVGAWVYKNFDSVVGLAFLPYDGGSYAQAPYQEVTEEKYLELLAKTPTHLDWDELIEYTDQVEGAREKACASGYCEI